MDQTNINFARRARGLVERIAHGLEANAEALQTIATALQEQNDRADGVVLDDETARVALDVVDWTIEEAQAGRTGAPPLEDLGDLREALTGE